MSATVLYRSFDGKTCSNITVVFSRFSIQLVCSDHLRNNHSTRVTIVINLLKQQYVPCYDFVQSSVCVLWNNASMSQLHAVSANRILWVYAGFWWYHGILVVHLQDSVGAFWAIKDQDASIRGLSVENVMTDGLSRVCIWWCIMLSLITKITGIYFVGEKC